jgi:predicted acylesterase/phospholipase RssA
MHHYRGNYDAYGGTSIGAVKAAAKALGFTDKFINEKIYYLFQENRLTGGASIFRPHPRLLFARGGGLHDWSVVRRELQAFFGINTRFKDVPKKLVVCVSDAYTRKPVYITQATHPDALVWEVLAATTAVWPVADAQPIESLGTGNRLYVDGGWSSNIPTEPFGDVPTDVVFLGGKEATVIKAEGFLGIARACLELSLYDDPEIYGREDDTMIPIRSQGSGFDFALSHDEITKRIHRGWAEAQNAVKSL